VDLRPALDPAASDETLRALIEEHSVREFIVQVIDTTFPSTSSFLSTDCRHREAPHHACCVSYSSIIHHIMCTSTPPHPTLVFGAVVASCSKCKCYHQTVEIVRRCKLQPHHTTHHTILEYSAIQHDTSALREPRCSLLAAAS